ncbi:hypothetical protein LRH25_22635 [Ideonella azotifigens]|uniref:ApeA N-terminal domain-containing protein n=1 Tax=Ideonella azotifigens TaxID=513160 RepID=A0ABN1KCH3_9BURK|nr:hypothetical protein [Ideonella azotifigens]MCD2343128.1 hypothetical protein [Ideonella azotifigens]
MKILRQKDGKITFFLDGPDSGEEVNFVRGAEQMPNNTYGFEIEFCSHDNPVFAFTHVKVMSLVINGFGKWLIESDSGNVLELVTEPLVFADPADAHAFKIDLGKLLSESVDIQQEDIKYITLGSWREDIRSKLELLSNAYATENKLLPSSDASSELKYKMSPWEKVVPQISPENVDDGINIAAAKARLARNANDKWDPFVCDTILCRSEKDWGRGYSSQANVPMTLAGYFLYSISKTRQARDRHNALFTQPIPPDVSDAKIQRDFDTWFWRRLIWEVFTWMGDAISGVGATDVDKSEWTLDKARNMGLLYVMVSKTLTGALGALSEPYQLKLQYQAFEKQSTQVLSFDNPEQETSELPGSDTSWLEYHSSMKDLTGLWFKAALVSVIKDTFGDPPSNEFTSTVASHVRQLPAIWGYFFKIAVQREDEFYSNVAQKRTNIFSDLNRNWSPLIERIRSVCEALASFLENWGNDSLTLEQQAWLTLPPRKDRKFLHYESAPPWEGRYDTMYPPFKRFKVPTYLVEHRFN